LPLLNALLEGLNDGAFIFGGPSSVAARNRFSLFCLWRRTIHCLVRLDEPTLLILQAAILCVPLTAGKDSRVPGMPTTLNRRVFVSMVAAEFFQRLMTR
jgi:hypothetical protein